VRANVLDVLVGILEYLRTTLSFDFPVSSATHVAAVLEAKDLMDPTVVEACLFLRDAVFVRRVLDESGDLLPLPGGKDGGLYFLKHIERFTSPDFIPTNEDVVRSRRKTTGIHETKFEYQGKKIILVDVGGQRPERRKWLTAFSGTSAAVLYFASASDYDSKMEEDRTTSRLTDAIQLFGELRKSPHLSGVPFAVLLNKMDLFQKKLSLVPIHELFPDFPAPPPVDSHKKQSSRSSKGSEQDCINGVEYLKSLFLEEAGSAPISVFPSTALDPDCCYHIWEEVWSSLVAPNLDESPNFTLDAHV